MPDNKHKKKTSNTILTDVQKEMAQPRITKSARIAEQNLYTTRTSEHPRSIIPGNVVRLVRSPRPSKPEKVQVAIDGAGPEHREPRIKYSLTEEHSHEAGLKQGARVEITVIVQPIILNR